MINNSIWNDKEFDDYNKYGNNNYQKRNSYKNLEDNFENKEVNNGDNINNMNIEKKSSIVDENKNNYNYGITRKKNYSNYDLDNFNNNKNSLQDLESKLSYLISEKKKYENELLKMPEHPRNLNEIKAKKGLNENINKAEKEINSIRAKIRNYDY